MAVYSPPQVYALARKHRFSPAGALGMVGVVATESGGRSDAVQPGGKGRGLVQIDLGQHPDITEAQAFDPDFAMEWAYNASGGNVAKLGAPLFYGPRDHPSVAAAAKTQALAANPEARDAATLLPAWQSMSILTDNPVANAGAAVGGALKGGVQDIGGFVVAVGKAALWVTNPHNWLRILEVVLGAALLLAGMWRLSPDTAGVIKSMTGKAAGALVVA